MRLLSLLILSITIGLSSFAQSSPSSKEKTVRPKLVVGLVIDQMRWDYLYRYNSAYADNGFKRLLKEGFSCENAMIPYTPTYTAPGHTCVYTGSIPAIHGIVGNDWYDRFTGKKVYCTDDESVSTVGSNTAAGKMSPKNMWATTIADELRLGYNFRNKVIGIALKDRGAILPAGHSANAAYWYDDKVGKWITSTHYINNLPSWVNIFNDKDLATKYMSSDWSTLLPMERYTQSTTDDKPYEATIKGENTVTFPHKLSLIKDDLRFEAFKTTPFAATYTFDFAKAAVENENLGGGPFTDFLAVSISSTDYIGHTFGPNSIEAQDGFLRLDRDIASFLSFLDTKVGKGNYLFFLTADHGVAHVPGFLKEHKINVASLDDNDIERNLNKIIADKKGIDKAISHVINYQIYLYDSVKQNVDLRKFIVEELKKHYAVSNAVDLAEITTTTLPEIQKSRITNGYSPSRSGDIQFIFKPGFFDGKGKGTTHGAWSPYDAHIPLLFYGWGIKPGYLNKEVYMTDIAPTIAAILQIQMPSGCIGIPIRDVMK